MVPMQYQPTTEKDSSIGYLQTYPQQPPQCPPQMHPYPMQYPPHHQPLQQYPYPHMAPMPLHYRPCGFMPHGPPAIYMGQQAIMPSAEPIVPHDNDVLMGRGGKNNLHKGNERLREMARVERAAYIKASKKEKSELSRELVKRVHAMSPPGRFLKCNRETGTWEVVDIEYAREKASQCLRDAVCHRNLPSSGASNSDSGSESSGSRSSTPVPSTGASDDEQNRNVVSPEATRQSSAKAPDDKGMISLPALDHDQEKKSSDTVDGCPRKFSQTFWEAVEILGSPACQPKLASIPQCIGGHIAFDMRHAEKSSAFDCQGDSMPNNNPAHGVPAGQEGVPVAVDMDDDDLPSVSGHSMFAPVLLGEEDDAEDPFEPMDAWTSPNRSRIDTWETSAHSTVFDDTPLAHGSGSVAVSKDVTNDELSPLAMDCEDEVEVASDDPFDFEFF